MLPAQQIALWEDRLRDLSAMGLHFAQNPYDTERYRTLQDLALEMLAFATGEPLEQIELLRATVFTRPTPMAVGDAAIIDAGGRIDDAATTFEHEQLPGTDDTHGERG